MQKSLAISRLVTFLIMGIAIASNATVIESWDPGVLTWEEADVGGSAEMITAIAESPEAVSGSALSVSFADLSGEELDGTWPYQAGVVMIFGGGIDLSVGTALSVMGKQTGPSANDSGVVQIRFYIKVGGTRLRSGFPA